MCPRVTSAAMTEDEEDRRAEAFVRRSYRTARLRPMVGPKECALLLGVDKMTFSRWRLPGSGPLGEKRTRMIPPARVGAGVPYADALRRRAARLVVEAGEVDDPGHAAKLREEAEKLELAAIEAVDAKGREVWDLEDVERFGVEEGRIRAPKVSRKTA